MRRIWMSLASELAHQESGLVMSEAASLAGRPYR